MVVAWLRVDDTNPKAVTRAQCLEAVDDALSTPDNHEFGILGMNVKAFEMPLGSRMQTLYNFLPEHGDIIL